MVANSFVEIYTLLFGWNMYEAIWDMMVGTGLAFIPFIVAVIAAFNSAYKPASSIALAQTELEVTVFTMIVVLMTCVLPFRLFGGTNMTSLEYQIVVPDCHPPSGLTGTGDTTGTTHDGGYGPLAGYTVHPPAAWSLIMVASSAITNSTIASMNCVNNYDFMLARISAIEITDNNIKQRVREFHNICYKKAVELHELNPVPLSTTRPAIEDIDWMGSHIFLNTTNQYYQEPSAYMSLADGSYGFSRDPATRDADAANTDSVNPSCREIWEGDGALFPTAPGLRAELYDSLPDDEVGDIKDDFEDWGYEMFTSTATLREKQDMFLKMVLQIQGASVKDNTDLQMGAEGLDAERGDIKNITETVVGGVGALGSPFELAQNLLVRTIAKNVAPSLAAFAQMLIILAAPLIMVFRSFKGTVFFQLAFMYFAIEFLAVIWAIAFWFDNRLIGLYYDANGMFDVAVNTTFLYTISIANYTILPIIWLTLAGIMGAGVMRGMNNDGGGAGTQTGGLFPRLFKRRGGGGSGGKDSNKSGGGNSKK